MSEIAIITDGGDRRFWVRRGEVQATLYVRERSHHLRALADHLPHASCAEVLALERGEKTGGHLVSLDRHWGFPAVQRFLDDPELLGRRPPHIAASRRDPKIHDMAPDTLPSSKVRLGGCSARFLAASSNVELALM